MARSPQTLRQQTQLRRVCLGKSVEPILGLQGSLPVACSKSNHFWRTLQSSIYSAEYTPCTIEGLLVWCLVEYPYTHAMSKRAGRSWRIGVKEPAQVQARISTNLTWSSLLTSR